MNPWYHFQRNNACAGVCPIAEGIGEAIRTGEASLLKDAYQLLEIRAQRIDDPDVRDSYLNKAPTHRAIREAWRLENQQQS